MSEYIYKGFKIHYVVSPVKHELLLYKADGHIECIFDDINKASPCKFHTESSSLENAEKEIRKLAEDYIDFEWKEFKKMQ